MKYPLGTKLYYSISEVADLTQLQHYTLRAWEKDFSCLKPQRKGKGGKNRAYRKRDIGIVLLIKQLLYEERFTVQGVRNKLKNEPELVKWAADAFCRDGVLPKIPTHSPESVAAPIGDSNWLEPTKTELRSIINLLS